MLLSAGCAGMVFDWLKPLQPFSGSQVESFSGAASPAPGEHHLDRRVGGNPTWPTGSIDVVFFEQETKTPSRSSTWSASCCVRSSMLESEQHDRDRQPKPLAQSRSMSPPARVELSIGGAGQNLFPELGPLHVPR